MNCFGGGGSALSAGAAKEESSLSSMTNGLPGGEPSRTTTAWFVSESRTSCPPPETTMEPVFPEASGRSTIVSCVRGGAFGGEEAQPARTTADSRTPASMPGAPRAGGIDPRSLIRRHREAASPTWTAKRVPRIPMVAVGVSKRADSGESFPISPDR